jgi:hypothetical protein
LLHSCGVDDAGTQERVRSFALSARELAILPSIVSKMEGEMNASSKDVTQAILKDVPVCEGELEKMRGGPGSSFHHALRIAREVFFLNLLYCIFYP